MIPKLCTTFIFSLLLLQPIFVHAAAQQSTDTEMEQLLGLGFEALLTVSIASKKEETLNDAPGIVAVITADDIKRYGARNLRDVLDRQTSMQIIGSNLFPHNKSSMRGVATTYVDSTVLILLNGRPLRESAVSSINHDIYAYFPINSLQKIEIIRGPGSVLYGTNAFSGAINLVTKDAPKEASANLAVSYGSFGSKQNQITAGGTWNDLELFGSFQTTDIEGDDFHNINGEFGSKGTYKTGKDGEQLFLNLKYKGLTVNALHSDTSTDHARSLFVLPSTEHEFKRQFIDIGYQHDFSDSWSINANFSHQDTHSELALNPAGDITKEDAKNYLYELSSTIQPIDDLNIIVGGTYRKLENSGDSDFESTDKSLYTQWDYQLLDWLNVIGGLQYNKPDELSGDYSPRLALIAQLNDNWSSKLLYGKSFREASGVERFLNIPSIIVGDESLSPETIKTFDFQVMRTDENSSFAVTYFHSEHEDIIARVGASPIMITNTGSITYDGVEFEGRFQLNQKWQFSGNLTYQTNENDSGMDDVTYAPDLMVKAGVSYDSLDGIQWSVFNSYFAESTLQNEDITTVTATNREADSYNLLTANLRINLGDVLNEPALSGTTVSIYGDNLLDEKIYFPSTSRTSVDTLPHHSGRGLYATISIDF
ncbi:MAG: hypothetical protein COC04_05860 [Gammaproteobacteria bacterium]|nr:MAG: hypothetical protein COC04_05860 [Gammaproteobacteria bacterium]